MCAELTQQPNPRRRAFRLQAKKLFLTYPQCQCTKQLAMSKVMAKFGTNLEYAVISREDHHQADEEGCLGAHLHMIIVLKEKFRSRQANCLDCLVDPPQHGNYQSARNAGKVMKYVVKEGYVPPSPFLPVHPC